MAGESLTQSAMRRFVNVGAVSSSARLSQTLAEPVESAASRLARIMHSGRPMIGSREATIAAAVTLATLAAAGAGVAQVLTAPPPVSAIGDTLRVMPGRDYQVGGWGRRMLGIGWRDLWAIPVPTPVFDLGSYAGGLRILQQGGGFQSITLHLIEQDGWREYRYRSVDKFPLREMPDAVKGTLAGDILEDQVSTLFPAAPLLVPPLMRAIGALHVPAELYVMPDDQQLGEYRELFAGVVGTVELKPDEAPDDEPGFAGSRKIKGTDNFFDDLRSGHGHRLDEAEFFAVRLIDFLINDSDRTADNFDWARFGKDGEYTWRPIARDRDRAFMDARGWLNRLVMRRYYPKLLEFEPEYSLAGLTHTSYPLDRRLLQRLTRADAERIALRVRQAISDDVIEAVIGALPRPWLEQTSAPERMRHVLRERRARLPAIAREFYEDLAGEVDVYGTDEEEAADVLRHPDGRVTVTISGRDEPKAITLKGEPDSGGSGTMASRALVPKPTFYERTFLPSETMEIRLYLGGGDDRAIVRGAASGAIAVRVIGDAGADVLVDSAAGGATYFYDSQGENEFVTARATSVSVQRWTPPEPALGLRLGSDWAPDWGSTFSWTPAVAYREGAGVVLGFGPEWRAYGFRRLPHHWEVGVHLLVGLGNQHVGVEGELDYRAENSPLALMVAARATQLEAIRFYGYGNETPALSRDLSLVEQDRIALTPSLVWQIGWRTREGIGDPLRGEQSVHRLLPLIGRLEAGPVFEWTHARPEQGSPLASLPLLGNGPFGRAGLRFGLELERTDRSPAPTRGWTFEAELSAFPPVWDVAESFSTAEAVGTAYVPLSDGGPHLAFRAGGAMAAGPFPVQRAATLGGHATLRGYPWQRYSGDTSAHGSSELRVPVGSINLFLRWQAGVFVLADAGRVWYNGSSDGGWHTGGGGGIWLSSLGKGLGLTYARGEEGRVYVHAGTAF